MRTIPSISLLAAAIALLVGAPAPAQGAIKDVVVTKKGRRIRGVEVTEMTSTTIKYRRGESEQELPAVLLARIDWDDPPESFALAAAALRDGKFTDAANLYEQAANDTDRAPLKAEARYLAAEALVRGSGDDQARAQAAVSALKSYLGDLPDGYRVPDASLLLGRAELQAGQAAEAEQILETLANDSLAKNWGTVWEARAKFEQAKAAQAQGKLGDARSLFRSAQQAADLAGGGAQDPELLLLKAQAAVGEGESFIAEKKFDDALRFFRDLAAKSSENSTVRAAAKAGEGEALFLDAAGKNVQTGLRAAQIALAEANLLDEVSGPTTAKAMYYSGKILLALGPEREASNFKTRAAAYFTSVAKDYPETVWATLANEELKR